jgi:formylglycine-generating enzyme required for sulfatase activity
VVNLGGQQWGAYTWMQKQRQTPPTVDLPQALVFSPGAFRMGVEPFFKRIDNSRPYEPLHMTTAKWGRVPVTTVALADVIASQYEVTSSWLRNSALNPGNNTSFGGDAYPLFVRFRGELYLVDGHHRVTAAIAQGKRTVQGRVLYRS